ncbi:hypothetical protein DXG01_016352 [Tephrocybe rancida]|nr:hypothetical protein DXG01_016352 [Tephrocybe rancida]
MSEWFYTDIITRANFVNGPGLVAPENGVAYKTEHQNLALNGCSMGCITNYICPVPVLFLPPFFESQARPFLLDAAAIQDASDDDRTARRDSTSSIATPVEHVDHRDVEMITLPNIPHIARPDIAHIPETSPLPHGWNSLPPTLPLIASISPMERLNDASLKQVESSWTAYIKRCRTIWLAVASSSGIALA